MSRTKCCLEEQIAKKLGQRDLGAKIQIKWVPFGMFSTPKNQPRILKSYKNRPGTMKTQPGTMKNQPGTMKTMKTGLEPQKTTWNHEKS